MTQEKISREQLYEQVWSTPMRKLALEYGVSDVALAKMCGRLKIPKPGRGYWARLAAGERIKRPRLPPSTDGREFIYLERTPQPDIDVPPPEVPPDAPVPETLQDAHKVVRKIAIALMNAPVDEHQRVFIAGARGATVAVSLAVHRRALLILDALCKVMITRGHEVDFREVSEGSSSHCQLAILVDGESVVISMDERLTRMENPPSEPEKSARKYDYIPDGKLSIFVHDGPYSGRHWSDMKRTTLERRLGHIVLDVESVARRRREQREADELRQRLERKARERQQAERARAEHQALLVKDLKEMAGSWELACRLRGFLLAVDEATPPDARDETFTAWFRWATSFLEATDPTLRFQDIPKPVEPMPSGPDRPSAPQAHR
jgi:hypothetical protein